MVSIQNTSSTGNFRITSNDRSFGCPITYTDSIHISILFIGTSSKKPYFAIITSNEGFIWRFTCRNIGNWMTVIIWFQTHLSNADFVHLAHCFSPHTLVDLALTHFNLTQAEVDSIEYDSSDAAAFKRTILYRYSNKTTGHEGRNIRKVNN